MIGYILVPRLFVKYMTTFLFLDVITVKSLVIIVKTVLIMRYAHTVVDLIRLEIVIKISY